MLCVGSKAAYWRRTTIISKWKCCLLLLTFLCENRFQKTGITMHSSFTGLYNTYTMYYIKPAIYNAFFIFKTVSSNFSSRTFPLCTLAFEIPVISVCSRFTAKNTDNAWFMMMMWWWRYVRLNGMKKKKVLKEEFFFWQQPPYFFSVCQSIEELMGYGLMDL